MNVTDITIVLPSLNPDHKLTNTIKGLIDKGFKDIVLVNDGSDAEHLEPFNLASELPQCTVLKHDVNHGKGRALKTAFEYCIANRKDIPGVITVDGDGQHHPDDIYACGEEMLRCVDKVVLGVRDFSLPEVPFKSRYGNNITKFAFRALCGIKISDTQTGLRAIPARFLPDMITYRGERFEYETNMLLEMKSHNIEFTEVKIQTIYLEDNSSSHFHPFRDSFKIYKIIFKYGLSAIISTLIDLGIFTLGAYLLRKSSLDDVYIVYIATVGARIISSFCNYKINHRLVFKSGKGNTFVRYYTLCVIQMLVSASLVALLSHLTSSSGILETVLKACVDTVLFFISFRIQRNWVFK